MTLINEQIRRDFPILQSFVYGKPLIYLDNAATTQKPQVVIDAISEYYRNGNANVHRGLHYLSEHATHAYEFTRERIARFLGLSNPKEIVFVRGATEAINLVASSFSRQQLKNGDAILISMMEHHSNMVPWYRLCEEKGAQLNNIPINAKGELILEAYERLLSPRTKLVALTHVSNVLGTINPIKPMIEMAHDHNIPVLIDGAQAVPHMAVDLKELDCDFYTFSSHKCYGPTGIGVLYAKSEYLEQMIPYQSGGSMIETVDFDQVSYLAAPYKFEAGTPHIAGVIGLAAAIDYLTTIGYPAMMNCEQELLRYANEQLSQINDLRLIGTAADKTGVISFTIDTIHPHDIASILDREGIAIRAGTSL